MGKEKSFSPVDGWDKWNCGRCDRPFWRPKRLSRANKFCTHKCYGLNKIGEKHRSWTKSERRVLSIKKLGSKNPQFGKRGELNAGWKGGYTLDRYLRNTRTKKWKHREVMEEFLGRKLKTDEIVHHKNHNKLDNIIQNLELMNRSEHARLHMTGRKKMRGGKSEIHK